jgi:predicted ribosome quality control (RQC) complex YloA/Tae2 family protein
VLERAARAAAAHSESKHAGLVPVDYVLRKHVRKPRRAAPGLVTYQNEKTVFISTES